MAMHDDSLTYDDADYAIPDYPCPDEHPYSTLQLEGPHCNSTHDSVLCWPATPFGHVAYVRCPPHINYITLNPNENASKLCSVNGSWVKADYDPCMLKESPEDIRFHREELHNLATRIIFGVGFSVSTAALVIALTIFLYFRSLRCLRNMIHCHLMFSFVLKNILWITLHNVTPVMVNNFDNGDNIYSNYDNPQTGGDAIKDKSAFYAWGCKILISLYNYTQSTNYYWMLCEGLYLHIMIVYAYSVDRMRLWCFAIIGWGLPVIVVLVWGIVKFYKDNNVCWLPLTTLYYDFIFIAPILLVLLLNTLCLVSTVYIIFSKLSNSNTPQARQFWQTLKGTLILFPLLGVIYVVLITPPSSNPIASNLFRYFNAFAHSCQGLIVAVFYCFLNREVRQVLRNRFSRYRDNRSLAAPKSMRTSISMRADASVLLHRQLSLDKNSNGNAKYNANGNANGMSSDNSESHCMLDMNGGSNRSNGSSNGSTNGSSKNNSTTTKSEILLARMNGVKTMDSLEEEENSAENCPMLEEKDTST